MNPQVLTRALKGPTAQIVLVFILAGTALDFEEILIWTNLTHNTARQALRELKGMGFLARSTAAHNRHIWQPAGDLLPQFTKFWLTASRGGGGLDSVDSRILPPPSIKESQFTKNYQSTLFDETRDLSPEPREDLLAACQTAGIAEPARSYIARLDIQPDYIAAHVDAAPNLGAAIYRICNRWKAPEPRAPRVTFDVYNPEPEPREHFCIQEVPTGDTIRAGPFAGQPRMQFCRNAVQPGQRLCAEHQASQ